jgi:hypothetical protein
MLGGESMIKRFQGTENHDKLVEALRRQQVVHNEKKGSSQRMFKIVR